MPLGKTILFSDMDVMIVHDKSEFKIILLFIKYCKRKAIRYHNQIVQNIVKQNEQTKPEEYESR